MSFNFLFSKICLVLKVKTEKHFNNKKILLFINNKNAYFYLISNKEKNWGNKKEQLKNNNI